MRGRIHERKRTPGPGKLHSKGQRIVKSGAIFVRPAFLSMALLVGLSPSYAQKQKPPGSLDQNVSDDDVVRVSTNLVTVPVNVMDRQGRFIPDLRQEQFHIFEDGAEQKIAYFDSAEKPFTVALLLDTSDSTRFKLKDIQDAALEFVEQLRPDDRVIVAAFDKNFTVLAEATSDRRILTRAIRRVQTGGSTAVYNAIDVIINQRLNRIRGRKAIVLFTDGVDTASQSATYEGTLRFAQELDSLVYPIQYNTFEDATKDAMTMNAQVVTAKGENLSVAYARAERYLRQMADNTGGRFYYAASLKHLREVFTSIARELREQYSIGYYPKSGGQRSERRIKVKVSAPGVVVGARRGYIYKAPSQ
jgi:Ca-activated chloride channel family protein